MPENKLQKSKKYPGVYWREIKNGTEADRKYYIIYRRGGRGSKKIEEPVGKASQGMTEAKASRERVARIEGKLSNVERRQEEAAQRLLGENGSGPATLDKLWEIYKEDHMQNPSIKDYTCRYKKHIQKLLGEKTATEITSEDIRTLRKRVEAKKLAPQSVKHALSLVRSIMNYAHKKGLIIIPSNLIFDMPKVDNEKTENMTAEQTVAYFKAIDEEPDQDAAAFLRLALFTGMRKGALMALKWEDINFEQSTIRLRGEAAKNGKTTYLPLSQQAINVLNSINRSGEFIFPGKNQKQRKEFSRIARRVREKAGLPKSFRPLHGLRHCYASWLASSGKISLYELQKLLTHSSIQMTQRYAHLNDEALKRGADLAGDIFGGLANKSKPTDNHDS